MNESEQKPAVGNFETTDNATVAELRAELRSLQSTVSFALMLIFVFSLAVNIFLHRQASMANAEATNGEAMVNNYVTTGENQAREFWFKLVTYNASHPDFAPVYNKWSQVITMHPTAAPAPAPAKK